MSLLTVGTMAFDRIETPFGLAERIVGGAATYIALTASYFTQPVQVVSVVGDDFPDETVKDLLDRGIDLSGVQVREGEKSFFWSGKYHYNMNDRDTLDTQLNVLADFDPILPDEFKQADYVMLGNLTPDVQMRVLDQMEIRPKLVALDTMNFWMDNAPEGLQKVIAKVDLLIINDEEARQLSEEYSLVKAAQKIMQLGPKTVIIKKGEHGALLFQGEKIFSAPALPLEEVFDPTGAGDTFAGGVMGYLAAVGDLSFEGFKRSLIYGSAMASFCVEKFGPEQLINLSGQEIKKRVHQFIELTDFDMSIEPIS